MLDAFKNTWRLFQRTTFFIGEIISTVVMAVFYFSIFLFFALPARFLNDYLFARAKNSTWRKKASTRQQVEYFKSE